ncbi:MAG: MtnX-like HAD-IB family phosphatase [Thaumarchaeota archaeon]|nr:MtnX-like HAD-IB family phosphatase [Nitrososphaerota archaeon]
MNKLTIISDFDGTISLHELGEIILKKFVPDDWEKFYSQMIRGNLSFDECITKQYSLIHERNREKIINSVQDKCELRKGFRNFVDFVNDTNDQFVIVSGGLDFIVDYCLTSNKISHVRYVAPQIKLDSRGATLLPPPGTIVSFGHSNFKMDLVVRLKLSNRKVLYIGDGLSDFAPASLADMIFAVKGSSLEKKCRNDGIAYKPFNDFDEIKNFLICN